MSDHDELLWKCMEMALNLNDSSSHVENLIRNAKRLRDALTTASAPRDHNVISTLVEALGRDDKNVIILQARQVGMTTYLSNWASAMSKSGKSVKFLTNSHANAHYVKSTIMSDDGPWSKISVERYKINTFYGYDIVVMDHVHPDNDGMIMDIISNVSPNTKVVIAATGYSSLIGHDTDFMKMLNDPTNEKWSMIEIRAPLFSRKW